MRDHIFISYSHADSSHQLRLRKHLATFERAGNIRYWSDTQLKTGDLWRNEIENNLHKTAVAILLISADFLDSDFIRSNELPPLLKAWQDNGVHILPVVVKPCNFSHVKELSCFQAVNDPDKTIEEMSFAEQERTWANLSKIAYERLLSYQETHSDDESYPMNNLNHEIEEKLLDTNDNITNLFDLIDFDIEITDEPDAQQNGWGANQNYVEQEDFLLYSFIQNLLDNPKQLQSYYVYTYEHIDILTFLPVAKEFLGTYPGYNALISEVSQLFLRNGWEGDGIIRLMWFPPFLKIGIEDTWGTLAWFVKQSNNGTAFIASPVSIPYLSGQNHILFPDIHGFYTAQIAEVRANINPNYRCFKIRGLLDAVTSYVPDESHWLIYPAGEFDDPSVNDWVRFKVKKLCALRDFPDIKNTRNIYLYSMEII